MSEEDGVGRDELALWRDGHVREHDLLSDAHRREHEGLLRELAGAAVALEGKVRDTATAFDIRMRDATAQLETRVKEVADLHWSNHRVEHGSDQRAIDKVESTVATRFESVNEFREQLRTQASTFVTRNEADSQHGAMNDRLVALETFRNQNEGRRDGMAPMVAIGLSVLTAVIVAVVVAFVTTTR